MRRPGLRVSLLARLLTVALAIIGLSSILALFAPVGWPFELFSHFRPQYAAGALAVAALLAWQRRSAYAAAALVLALWHATPLAQRALAEPPVLCEGSAFTVVTANLHYVNQDTRPFLDWLARHPADLVVVQEVSDVWARDLARLPDLPHQYVLPRADAYGIGVLSRWPLESVAALDLADDGLPSLSGVVRIDGQPVRFLGLHTRWPVLPGLARSRDDALQRVAAIAREERLPVVVLGDLNLSPDAPAFGRLLDDAGLQDVMHGPDWSPTWQASFWPLALRIDHVLVNRELCVDHAEVGAPVGSDHRPVSARLQVRPRSVAAAAPNLGSPGR
jgi:endonuclease/exonuclease/phosphatase family metal-dependent hydrolase